MPGILDIALHNLLSPVVLFFVLGSLAGLARSELTVPESVGKGLALYLMLSIGFKGGVELASNGLGLRIAAALAVGALLSLAIPLLAFALLRAATPLNAANAAALAAHYGSISIVTFVAASDFVASKGLAPEGFIVAVVAIMETPAILSGIWLARRYEADAPGARPGGGLSQDLLREILLNGSVVVLVGSFLIGAVSGKPGMVALKPFVSDLFRGALSFFMLDMGLLAARRLRDHGRLPLSVLLFGLYMPLLGGCLGLLAGLLLGLSVGGTTLFMVLAASASYIAVPAAMRLAVPKANPAIYVTLSLAVTFPFNLSLGIPLYHTVATWAVGR